MLSPMIEFYNTNQKEVVRFVKFSIVGAVGAGVDFGIYNLCIRLFGFVPAVAGTISFVAAVVSNFTWNRYWTIPDSRSKPLASQFAQFFVINAAGILIRIPILHFMHSPLASFVEKFLPVAHCVAGTIGNNAALALAIGIVMVWNFFVNRYITYSDVD